MIDRFAIAATPDLSSELTVYDLLDEIVNQNEASVLGLIDALHQNGRLPCACRDCLLDIAALALNSLGAHYTVSLHQDLYVTPEQEQARQQNVKEAVDAACQRVSERPHH